MKNENDFHIYHEITSSDEKYKSLKLKSNLWTKNNKGALSLLVAMNFTSI